MSGDTRERRGGDREVETPVPIPNTEVKHLSGEDSSGSCENSGLPGQEEGKDIAEISFFYILILGGNYENFSDWL